MQLCISLWVLYIVFRGRFVGKIEKLLKEKSMTKNKLATLAGINKNSLIDLKMGRKKSLKFEDVVKIADVLDISLDEFRKG